MKSVLPIGDFSRATHLSVKMLRHYHELGLLEPAEVDAGSGYRRYAAEQIVTAQIIRRFRDLEMLREDIHPPAFLPLGRRTRWRPAVGPASGEPGRERRDTPTGTCNVRSSVPRYRRDRLLLAT